MPVLGLAGCHWRKTGKLQVRFHRNIAASSLAADCNVPQRPPAELENPVHDWKNESVETKQPNHRSDVLHLFRWSTHTHPPAGGWKIKVRTVKWEWEWREMKMRWRWKWDESYLTRTRRGERNAEGKRKHQHKETWPTTGKPWKGKEKEKRRQTETEKDQRRGGKDGRAWTNLPQRTYAYLSTRRTQPTWREENAGTHEKRDPWGTS